MTENDRAYILNPLDIAELESLSSILQAKKPQNIHFTAGQHPLYPPNSMPVERVVRLLDNHEIVAVGEIGLDKRNADIQWQKKVLLDFLDIASQYDVPAVIHCVGLYHTFIPLVKKNFPRLLMILHGFQESTEIIKELKPLNVIFSLHKNAIKVKNAHQIVSCIIKNYDFGFETDIDETDRHDVSQTISEIARFLDADTNTLIEKQSCSHYPL
jgi:Tat protein secretion system quality control protein TatD with DNase activity